LHVRRRLRSAVSSEFSLLVTHFYFIGSRPVWADDEWLKQYGHGAGEGIATEDNAAEGETTTEDGEQEKGKAAPKLPRVYLGIKIGIR
jgi:hypothetical protein